ncbi:DUF4430 domain-containing protein [Isoptericola sp. NEAU-Y5]|uniref:DUF4430 domain-containing protein n=1 Tax=Isoptericola luteus TaxID=2879484 RepID=A0ABS7ZFS7_9MICO|nr:DUF4430 domain-containing protein [Isoptericola sp. NEAU-Y5]MCA5893880.1 DUF4430 domain-containing protein [Isoptericola sp. NEAU-Y5]
MKTRHTHVLRRALAAVPATLLAVGLVAGCGGAGEGGASPSAPTSVDPSQHVAENLTEFSYEGEDGRTALELLLEHDPDAAVQGEGENAFVTGIGGHEADADSEFWALSVDGEQAQVGAGSLETKDGQEITWTLEAFE